MMIDADDDNDNVYDKCLITYDDSVFSSLLLFYMIFYISYSYVYDLMCEV